MHLFPIVLAAMATAGPLRFAPDTVCAGGTTTCSTLATTVKNTSKDSADFDVRYIISPTDAKSELAFQTSKFGLLRWGPTYTLDSIQKLPNGYRHPLRSGYVRPMKLAPGDSSKLESFMFGNCLGCLGASGTNALPSLGHGEMVSLVFGSTMTGFDTLHAKVNKWTTGGVVSHPPMHAPSGNAESFRANGQPLDVRTRGISHGQDGSKIQAAPLTKPVRQDM